MELASLESMNQPKDKWFTIDFLGEVASKGLDYINDKVVEGFSPDYTVIYTFTEDKKQFKIYTEYERTRKSYKAILQKLNRYRFYFSYPNGKEDFIIRFIFQTPGMERGFWLNLILNGHSLINMKIITTNISLITGHKDFTHNIYAKYDTISLVKNPKLSIVISDAKRLRLVGFENYDSKLQSQA